MTDDSGEAERVAAARNPRAPAEMLAALAHDPSPAVIRALLARRALPEAAYSRLLGHPDPELRALAVTTLLPTAARGPWGSRLKASRARWLRP